MAVDHTYLKSSTELPEPSVDRLLGTPLCDVAVHYQVPGITFLPYLFAPVFIRPCFSCPNRRRCSSGNELLPKRAKGPPSGRMHTTARPHCRGFPLSSRHLLTPACRRPQGPTQWHSEPPVTVRRRRAGKRNGRPGPSNPLRSI